MMTFRLPMPPSVNALFLNLPGRGRVKTSAYKRWLQEAAPQVRAPATPIAGDYSLSLQLGPRRKNSDLDNRIKAVSDLLVARGVVADDRDCVLLIVEWAADWRGPPGCVARVTRHGVEG